MSPPILASEDLEARFWLRSVAIGGWASLVVGAAGVAYAIVFAEDAAPLVARLAERLAERVPHSLGTASSPADGPTFDQLHRSADAELYADKFAGRQAA
jgi:hypothetical protein